MSLAALAATQRYVRPVISADINALYVLNGRHALDETRLPPGHRQATRDAV